MPPKINRAKCRLCGACVFQCGKHVFTMTDSWDSVRVNVSVVNCVDCFICEYYCPSAAIKVRVARKKVL